MNLRNRNVLVLVGTFSALLLSTALNGLAHAPLKVGFLMCGTTKDMGWNYAQQKGREYLAKELPKEVETTEVEQVPENSEAERVIEKMIAQGNKLIFTTCYGYLEPVERVASRHPDVIFMQSQREKTAANLGSYNAIYYDPLYIAGMVAGKVTKTNQLGFIGGHAIAPVLLALNAFTLGARSVNPKVTVRAVWLNTWADPGLEAESTKTLIDAGVDVIASNLDSSVTVARTAERYGKYSVGTHADIHEVAPKGWLTGSVWNWGPLYAKIAKQVRDHTWKPAYDVYSMKEGYVTLAPFGPQVSPEVRKQALDLEKRIKEGKFVVFRGPLKDKDGKLRLAANQVPSPEWLATMDWFVPGVEGSAPKK